MILSVSNLSQGNLNRTPPPSLTTTSHMEEVSSLELAFHATQYDWELINNVHVVRNFGTFVKHNRRSLRFPRFKTGSVSNSNRHIARKTNYCRFNL